jgi:hypothetical protein
MGAQRYVEVDVLAGRIIGVAIRDARGKGVRFILIS